MPTDLPSLLALASAATPGPWFSWCQEGRAASGRFKHSVCNRDVSNIAKPGDDEGHECVADAFGKSENEAAFTAAFIAASREAVPAIIAELSAARPAAALLVRAREALSEIVTLCVDPEDKRVDLAKNLVLACGIAKEALVAIGEPEGQGSNV